MLNNVMPRRNYFLTIFMGYYKHVACIKIFGAYVQNCKL